MSGARRRSFEAGHRPKFMVVVDETDECGRAVRFAARRCARTGATLLMLGVMSPPENFEFLGVGDALRAEAEEEAEAKLAAAAAAAREAAGLEAEHAIKVGDKSEAVLALIEEDQDVSFLVLGAATGGEGPGPLVSSLTSQADFPVPIVIVPGGLSDEAIDALAG